MDKSTLNTLISGACVIAAAVAGAVIVSRGMTDSATCVAKPFVDLTPAGKRAATGMARMGAASTQVANTLNRGFLRNLLP